MSRLSSLLARATLSAVFAASASAATAEDFELDVPVQLSKLDPAFTQGKVTCEVHGITHDSGTGWETRPGPLNAVIGSGETSFAIAQGGFNGPVAVKFNANRPKNEPSDGRSWRCSLVLIAGNLSQSLCTGGFRSEDSSGPPTPAWMKLDRRTVKGCAQGNIPKPPGR
jgi:hypothetical protein